MIARQILQELTLPSLHQQLFADTWQWMKEKYVLSSKTLSLVEINQLAQKLNQKQTRPEAIQKQRAPHKMETWAFGELKIFEAVCILYSLLYSIQLQQFAQPQFIYLKKIFLQKSENFIKFEVASLLKNKVKNTSQWKKAQLQLFALIIQEDEYFSPRDPHKIEKYQWRYYSFQLFTRSKGKYYRSLQQCREKWINHLNPDVNHAPWHIQEDIKLFELIAVIGYKWSAIAKAFDMQRTEHMVKNRFNSLIKAWKNKETKNIPAHEIASKVLKILNEKALQGKYLEKKEILELFSKETLKKEEEISDLPQQDYEQPAKPSQMQQLPVEKLEQKSEPKEENSEEERKVDQNNQKKIQMIEWNIHFQEIGHRYSFANKEERNTWDDDYQLQPNRKASSEARLDVIEVQGLDAFRFELEGDNYGSFKESCRDKYFPQMLDYKQHQISDASWMLQLEEKDMLAWVD